MPGLGTRVLDKTLSHLATTLEQAEQAHTTSGGGAFAQSLDARVKVIGAGALTIAVVSCRRVEPVLAVLLLLTLIALVARVTWGRLAVAWASGLFFAAIVALPAFFMGGRTIALLLISRSEASLTCWLCVVMTTPFNRILQALRALHVPVVCIAIFSMTFRYIFLLVETAQDMLLSRRSRIVGRLSPSVNRKILVSTTGVLLSKSVQMSEDVYQAMTSRGFRGDVRLLEDFNMRTADWLALFAVLSLSGFVLVAGR